MFLNENNNFSWYYVMKNAEIKLILYKRFIMWVIIQYFVSNRVVKMDSEVLAKTDSSVEARVTVHSPHRNLIVC